MEPHASPSGDARRGLAGGWGGLGLQGTSVSFLGDDGEGMLQAKALCRFAGNDDGDAFERRFPS